MPKLIRNRVKKNTLQHLYLKRKLNLKKIGKIVGFSARTIQILAHEYSLPLRPPGNVGPAVTKQDLERLYVKKQLSSRKIAKIYKCAYSYIDKKIRDFGFPVKTLAGAHIKTLRAPFSGNLTEKAYLIGFRIGDLRVRKIYKNSETIHVDCGSTKPEQIKLIKRLFQKYGKIWISRPGSNGKTQIECSLNNSFSFLLKKYQKFPSWISRNSKLVLSAIAGFSDAEGSFFVSGNNKRSVFSLGNYNTDILNQIKTWLEKSGFNPGLFMGVKKGYTGKDGYSHKEDYWILNIYRKADLYKFTKTITPFLRHKDKIYDAARVIKNINLRNKKYGFIGM